MKLNVAVLMGGESAEAQVSRNSAAQVAAALASKGHSVELVEIDAQCTPRLLSLQPDVVFPALHGPPGEDGTVQGYLEQLSLPYVGSGVRGSALAMDKAVAKLIFQQHQLPVLDDIVVPDNANLTADAQRINARLGQALVIKPLNQGSAIGVTLLPNGGDLVSALETALEFGPCMVEPFLLGKEITVGVLQTTKASGEPTLIPHPVIEIRTADDEWYDYDNRYQAGQSEHLIPARLSQHCQNRLQQIAVTAHTCLGLRDLSRADFIVTDQEQIALLEVNALPGMTSTSLYPDGAKHLGYDFADLTDTLVRQAYQRRN